jgi:hypothetical protein
MWGALAGTVLRVVTELVIKAAGRKNARTSAQLSLAICRFFPVSPWCCHLRV